MTDAYLRLRVKRLLNSDFRAIDLTMLFLAAREICAGRETVKEIGDFVAHKTDRTRGATTKELRNFIADLRFKFENFDSHVPMDQLPLDFSEIVERCLKRADPQHLKMESGLTPSTAMKMLPSILATLKENGAGGLALEKPASEREVALISYLVSFTTIRPAFTADRLYKEFSDTLLANGLLLREELKAFNAIKPMIALFAVEHLNGSNVRLEDGSTVFLRATPIADNGTLGVGAYIILPRKNEVGKPLRILHGSAIFLTGLFADDWCDNTLSQRPFAPWWSHPIELTDHGKLSRISKDSTLTLPSLGVKNPSP